MRQAVDVLAVFDIGAVSPRPIRFKVLEHGIKTTVRVTDIRNIEWLGAGGVMVVASNTNAPQSAMVVT